jgi:hypothetical protein
MLKDAIDIAIKNQERTLTIDSDIISKMNSNKIKGMK